MIQSSYPCLWFDGNVKEAALFYCSIFENSKIISENDYVVRFLLNGKDFMGLNGGPYHTFNEAVSFVVECDTQEEIDYLWAKLLDGGKEKACGWLTDKYGLCWQIVPSVLGKLMSNPEKAPKVVAALQQMVKFDIQKLLDA